MAWWIVKSEPDAYSFADLVAEGTGTWDGVRSHQAANNLKAMRPGDGLFFYHSVSEKAIVGTARVTSDPFSDPTDESGKWTAVSLIAEDEWEPPLTLAAVKAEPRLSDLALVRQSRLSVVPVSDAQATVIRELAGRSDARPA